VRLAVDQVRVGLVWSTVRLTVRGVAALPARSAIVKVAARGPSAAVA
jgi:hypothetical protein